MLGRCIRFEAVIFIFSSSFFTEDALAIVNKMNYVQMTVTHSSLMLFSSRTQGFPRVAQQLVLFRATVSILGQFLQFSTNSEISKQLLFLELALLPYFTMFQWTIYEFPVKKRSQILPLGQIMGARCMKPGCQVSSFFKQN